MRTEPHPRFYTDTTDTVLVAVPALLRTEWWSMISRLLFSPPAVGGTHIFRPGEPMLQILIVPVTSTLRRCPWTKGRPRSARCGPPYYASRPALAPIARERRTPTPCSTAPIAISFAPPQRSARDAPYPADAGGLPRPPRCTTLVIVMVVLVMMPAPPMMVVMVMPVPPPAMMMVMMVGELRFTAGRRLRVLPFVRHERGQGIRDRIEKLPIACPRRGFGRLRGRCGLGAADCGQSGRCAE